MFECFYCGGYFDTDESFECLSNDRECLCLDCSLDEQELLEKAGTAPAA